MKHVAIVLFTLGFAFCCSSVLPAEDWAHWRGLHRDDKVDELSGWKENRWDLSERWKVNVGEGSTTPVVIGNRLYTMGWKSDRDTVICIDTANGKALWSQSYSSPRHARNNEGDAGLYFGPTSSPEFDPETQYLYTLSSDGELNCWNTAQRGETVWKMNLYDEYKMPQRPGYGRLGKSNLRDYGYTTAPLVYRNWLIVEVGAPAGTVRAFDKRTGKLIWASEYKGFAGHSGSPVVMTVGGVPCLVVFTQFELVAMRLDAGHEGKTIGTYPWKSTYANNILTPTINDENVLISSYHSHEKMSNPSTCKLTVTLTGFRREWEQPVGSHIGSPIIHKDRVYMAGPQLYCLDWKTGKTIWKGANFNYGASCVLTKDERLIVLGNRGDLILAESAVASPEQFTSLASRKTLSGSDLWSHVVLSHGKIYCKDVGGNLLSLEIK